MKYVIIRNLIALNASGSAFSPATSGFYADPIRNITQTTVLGYDTTNKEITYYTPYYFGADLSVDQTLDNDNTIIINFIPYLPSPYNNNNGDMTSHVWTCPTTGLYKVSLRVLIAAAGDDIRSSDIYIVRNDGVTDFFEAGAKYFNDNNDDIQEGTLNCETLIPITVGDTLTGRGRVVLSSGSGRKFKRFATASGSKATELIIVRII